MCPIYALNRPKFGGRACLKVLSKAKRKGMGPKMACYRSVELENIHIWPETEQCVPKSHDVLPFDTSVHVEYYRRQFRWYRMK